MKQILIKPFLAAVLAVLYAGHMKTAEAAPYATDWIQGHNSRARLIAGGMPMQDGRIQRYAGFQVTLDEGWKTYWRQPGSAGGIPPHFDWQGSQNLKRAEVQYPAPTRMSDPTGDTIGYKHAVVFPIALEADNADRPIVVNLKVFFGVCREICIPAEAAFSVTLPPQIFSQTPPDLARAIERVPVRIEPGQIPADNLPSIVATAKRAPQAAPASTSAPATAEQPALIFDIRFPGGPLPGKISKGAAIDLFAETGGGEPLAMSKPLGGSQPLTKTKGAAQLAENVVRFEVPVSDKAEWQALAKTGLVLTMVSASGASEVRMPLP